MARRNSEEVGVEVEALQAVYGEESVRVRSTQQDGAMAIAVELDAKPHTGGDARRQLVSATLRLECGGGYPGLPPGLELMSIVGLDEHRTAQLQAALAQVARDLTGDLMLVPLCEAAVEWLTDNNVPEGPCSFCLEDLGTIQGDAEAVGDVPPIVRLSCSHCFHWRCFSNWWAWQQRQYSQQERQMITDHGGDNELVRQLVRKKLPDRWGRYYGIHCPTCRHKADEGDLSMWASDLDRSFTALGGGSSDDVPEATSSASVKDCLQPGLLRQVQQLQAQFSSILRIQQSKDGLIDATKRLHVPNTDAHGPRTSESEPGTARSQEPRPKHPRSGRNGVGRRGQGKGQDKDGAVDNSSPAQALSGVSSKNHSAASADCGERASTTGRHSSSADGPKSGGTGKSQHGQAGDHTARRPGRGHRDAQQPAVGARGDIPAGRPGSRSGRGRGRGQGRGRGGGSGDTPSHTAGEQHDSPVL